MKKMNNKGFSLVELIIVIAIMAILIVVLAPQYLRYVERSRNSTDMQNARTLMTAVETWAADPQATSSLGGNGSTFSITIANPAAATPIVEPSAPNPAGSTPVNDALTASGLTIGDIECSSRTLWDAYTITGTVNATGGITWSYTSYTGGPTGTTNTEFNDAMTGN